MTVTLERTRRVSLSESVLEQLLSSIGTWGLKPGARLPTEKELCAMCGVGRSSVREAIRVLVFMGLVDCKPGRGTVVTMRPDNPIPANRRAFTLQSAAMLDLYEVRSVLESGSAALAAKRATSGDLAVIERAAEAVEEQVALQRPYLNENVEFHIAIAKATHNNVLVESLQRLLGQMRQFRERVTASNRNLPARDVAQHRAILAAIQKGNDHRAQVLMSQHIETTLRAAHLRRVECVRPRPPANRRLAVSWSKRRPENATAH